MKTAHIADLHHSPERHKKVMYILDQVKETASEVELISNSGENFNNPYNVQNVFNELLDKWESITSIKPVVTINATQGKHEREGMVETLSRAGVVVMKPGNRYDLNENGIHVHKKGYETLNQKLMIFPVPHAHKGNIIAADKKGLSRDELNAKVNQQMANLYEYYGAMRAENPTIPALAVGHGVVSGKNTRDIKAVSEASIRSTEAELMKMGCDLYAWGHYHIPTEFELINGGYLGSFSWTYGEKDYKPAITIFDWDTMTSSRHELDINERKVYLMKPGDDLPKMTGHDVWVKNFQTEWTVEDLKLMGAGQAKVTTEVEKEHKIRSEEVMTAKTYPDKFKAVYPEATDRQLTICEEFWEADKAEGKIPQEKKITPLWIESYGSKAFMERLGKDKVRLDFTDYEGLTMVTGPGGHGKSTLFDYSSFRSVLFLQPNSLISTFELGDSYLKGGFQVNDNEYEINMFFKPTLKNPKAEYFAFEIINGERIPTGNTESGLRQTYDEWTNKVLGSPRSYATSVLHTQFSDNQSKFQGQSINPSIVQASNIELKSLFHELAGTDMKHLELQCKVKRDEFKDLAETEEVKKQGVEENIPSKLDITDKIEMNQESISIKNENLQMELNSVIVYESEVKSIESLEEENRKIDAVISSLNDQITEEKNKKTTLESDLSNIGNVDIEELNLELIRLEGEKTSYETRLKALPKIQENNQMKKTVFDGSVKQWDTDTEEIRTFNTNAQKMIDQAGTAQTDKERAESRIKRIKNQASIDEMKENSRLKTDYQNRKQTIESEIKTLVEQIKTGQEMIDNIKACPECGFIDPEGISNKERYNERLKERESEKEVKDTELYVLVEPEPVVIKADTSEEEKDIKECDIILLTQIPGLKDLLPKPTEPTYEDESIPTFDTDKYNKVKEQVSGYSEDRITELRTKITESQNRISSLETKVSEQVKKPIDYTAKEQLKEAEEKVSLIQKEIDSLKTDIKVNESKLADIDKQRESLKEYDTRIEEYQKEQEFWDDMKKKWGPSGIPARILEHTGPYVDQLANDILDEYYPTYKFHSETTRMGADGLEKEIFSINLINQETGREKPLSAISGEERNFCIFALREAFRRVNKENSMVEWTVQYEDEADAHVSSKYIQQFYDMVESFSEKRTVFAIAHSSEVKTRSASVIDITEV